MLGNNASCKPQGLSAGQRARATIDSGSRLRDDGYELATTLPLALS
jgi:hypothetical protein